MGAADFARVEQSSETSKKVHRGAIPAAGADCGHLEQKHGLADYPAVGRVSSLRGGECRSNMAKRRGNISENELGLPSPIGLAKFGRYRCKSVSSTVELVYASQFPELARSGQKLRLLALGACPMRLKLSKRKKAAAALASNGENPKGRRLVALKHKIRMFNQRRRRGPPVREKLSAILHRLAEDTSREKISCADLVHAVEDRAFGALLLIFSLPNIIPMPPGASGLLGLPLAFLSGQMMLGGKPWLPAFISSRSVERIAFSKVMQRVTPWLAKAEKLLSPRLLFLTYPAAETVLGIFCFVLSLSIILPIPLGNMLPAVAISLIALGILERDGVWIIAGAFAGALALFVVSGIILALAKAALHVTTNAFS